MLCAHCGSHYYIKHISGTTYIDKAVHQDCMKCSICGDTSSGQTHASLPNVIALFSISDLLSPYKQQDNQQLNMNKIIIEECDVIMTSAC